MNAPLTQAEEARILEKWDHLTAMFIADLKRINDPLEMLNLINGIIGACWEVRRAIDDGWHAANRRAFPDPPRAKRKIVQYTKEQLIEAIELMMRDEDEKTELEQ
jgi:hypothetical protein